MFTGIVEERGAVVRMSMPDSTWPDGTAKDGNSGTGTDGTGTDGTGTDGTGTDGTVRDGASARVVIRGPKVVADARRGASIAVSGVCLTVTAVDGDTFAADVMRETLDRTTADRWVAGTAVNLERPVTAESRLGGHIVQGHVDGVGTVLDRTPHAGYDEVRIAVPAPIGRYIAVKGSVAVDGVSLTVIDVTDTPDGTEFTLGIIPETRAVTTLGLAVAGTEVNIEVDMLAKYVERLLVSTGAPAATRPAPQEWIAS